ncbi:hypothetical protein RvY_04032 [Ramazzottius varieornatus]|uniref:Uncharacterized protein n=1 Tax=Ramazzottius varieornatus TaxID=947166 RepID=A0A1D1UZG5_RAMVA|nr:hypothetical protein RvY_04032 [Ramazzottius varieornatus]
MVEVRRKTGCIESPVPENYTKGNIWKNLGAGFKHLVRLTVPHIWGQHVGVNLANRV